MGERVRRAARPRLVPQPPRRRQAAGAAEVQLGSERRRVRARELRDGERDRVWQDVVLTRVPGVQRYARKAGRTIPVALLTMAEERTT